jgi:hypothetical protein
MVSGEKCLLKRLKLPIRAVIVAYSSRVYELIYKMRLVVRLVFLL